MITKQARVLLADDHALVAAGIAKLLEADFEIIGTLSDGRSLVEAAKTGHPDVILLDVSMPILNGIEAARQLRLAVPQSKLIFVTVHADRSYVVEAFRAGASGYVLKGSAASELPTAIREVLAGNQYVTPLIGKDVIESLRNGNDTEQSSILSARQREVLQLVAEGHSAKEIAAMLRISAKTVEFHKGLIMKKLGLYSTAQLTRYALEHGITGS